MALKIGMVSLGCSKNLVDSEVMLGMLSEHGMEIVADASKADVIIVNTCGFIDSAKQESIDTILEMAQYKQTGALKKLLVTGCLVQRYSAELAQQLPEVDGFMGVSDYGRLIDVIEGMFKDERPLCMGKGERFLKQKRRLITPKASAYVKISDGCDNRCTYCAIPLIRGKYVSRPYDDILTECRQLAADGVTEITFIAQDTSRYGSDFEGNPLLLRQLLHEASQIEGIHWVRVLYCYPDTVNDELLREISENPKICPYIDLPLQHISGTLLKRMNRRGTPEEIKALIKQCRAYGITLRTTMIVGFPGETDEQFEELIGFVRETRFDRLGAFTYSPEEGTAAALMDDQIGEEIKNKRLDALMMTQQAISLEINQARVGTACEVLVEGMEDGAYVGRSMLESPESDGVILLRSDKPLAIGSYVQARITACDAYDLEGEVL